MCVHTLSASVHRCIPTRAARAGLAARICSCGPFNEVEVYCDFVKVKCDKTRVTNEIA